MDNYIYITTFHYIDNLNKISQQNDELSLDKFICYIFVVYNQI